MARQIPSKSKHRIMTERSTRPSRSSSNTQSTTARSNRTSTCTTVSHGAQARGRPEHQEDNSAVQSPPRVLETSGTSGGSIDTSLENIESTPLVPAVIHVPTSRRTSTPSRVLEPLLRTPVDTSTTLEGQLWSSYRRFLLGKVNLIKGWRNGWRNTCKAKGGKTYQRCKQRGFRRRCQ